MQTFQGLRFSSLIVMLIASGACRGEGAGRFAGCYDAGIFPPEAAGDSPVARLTTIRLDSDDEPRYIVRAVRSKGITSYDVIRLSRNHPYSDGNKRIAFVAMAVFLELNGIALIAPEAEVVQVMVSLAAGHLEEPALAAWARSHLAEPPADAEA